MSVEENGNWRPEEIAWLPLSDRDLAMIGLTAVLEAQAKHLASVALKALEQKSHAEWIKLERIQFTQICTRLTDAAKARGGELERLAEALDQGRSTNQELRHIVIHASWGIGLGDEPAGYDYRRAMKLDGQDIKKALSASSKLRVLAHTLLLHVGYLIADGILPESLDKGACIEINVGGRCVRL